VIDGDSEDGEVTYVFVMTWCGLCFITSSTTCM